MCEPQISLPNIPTGNGHSWLAQFHSQDIWLPLPVLTLNLSLNLCNFLRRAGWNLWNIHFNRIKRIQIEHSYYSFWQSFLYNFKHIKIGLISLKILFCKKKEQILEVFHGPIEIIQSHLLVSKKSLKIQILEAWQINHSKNIYCSITILWWKGTGSDFKIDNWLDIPLYRSLLLRRRQLVGCG